MPRRAEDATGWIGYADFLTTIALVFFLVAMVYGARLPSTASALLRGTISDASDDRKLAGCLAQFGAGRQTHSSQDGSFQFRLDSVTGSVGLGLRVICQGFGDHSELVTVRAGDTAVVNVRLRPDSRAVVNTLPGDALFEPNSAGLTRAGRDMVEKLGRQLKTSLQRGDVLIVQGHTDDIPFPLGSGRDNWVLSGERAAAAARILTVRAYGIGIPECQVAIMGLGPSRPVQQVSPVDDAGTRARKRAKNRRIEFRQVSGSELADSSCAQ